MREGGREVREGGAEGRKKEEGWRAVGKGSHPRPPNTPYLLREGGLQLRRELFENLWHDKTE